jgi:hypothetical protein
MKGKKLHEVNLKSIKDLVGKDIIEKSKTKELRKFLTKKLKVSKSKKNKRRERPDDRLDELGQESPNCRLDEFEQESQDDRLDEL